MKAVVQRVTRAQVAVSGEVTAAIGPGMLVLLGIAVTDTPAAAAWMAVKLARLRIFADDEGRLNRSVLDIGAAALVVSQFTLLGDARRGNRPSFTAAASGEPAEQLYLEVVRLLGEEGVKTATGVFGAGMKIELVNDGPVTLIVESPE